MKRLYNLEYMSYNKEGQHFNEQIQVFLQELVAKYKREYDYSDMESIASSTVGYVFAVERLSYAAKKKKE